MADTHRNARAVGPPLRVGVFGHYGRHNLGDESLTAAVIANIRRLVPGAKFVGFSLDPEDTKARHGIPAIGIRRHVTHLPDTTRPLPNGRTRIGEVPGRRFFAACKRFFPFRRALRAVGRLPQMIFAIVAEVSFFGSMWQALGGVDILVIAGSNQFIDFVGGPWEFPYTLCKWTVLGALRGVKVAFLSVGAGPLDGWLSRYFVRRSLARAAFISVRDEGSARLLENIGCKRNVHVSTDLAFSLPLPSGYLERVCAERAERAGRAPGLIAVNAMPVFDPRYWPEADPVRYRTYVEALAGVCTDAARRGRQVALFGTHPADEWAIRDVIERLAAAGESSRAIEVVHPETIDELVALLASSEVTIGTRFHSLVLGLCVGTPTVAICYYRKSRELMMRAGVGEFAVEIDAVRGPELCGLVETASAHQRELRRLLGEAAEGHRRQLELQYEEVLASLAVRKS